MAGSCVVCGKFLSNYIETLCSEHKIDNKPKENIVVPFGYELDIYGHVRPIFKEDNSIQDRW